MLEEEGACYSDATWKWEQLVVVEEAEEDEEKEEEEEEEEEEEFNVTT